MSPIFRHQLRLQGTVRAQARGESRSPVRASIEYRDDEGQPALLPLRWDHKRLDLKSFRDQEVLVGGFVGTDARGYPVLYIHEIEAVRRGPSVSPIEPVPARRAMVG